MQSLSKREQKSLDRGAWLAKVSEVLEQIPENVFALNLAEKRTILRALIRAEGNRTTTARLLQISERGLYNKLKHYKLREL